MLVGGGKGISTSSDWESPEVEVLSSEIGGVGGSCSCFSTSLRECLLFCKEDGSSMFRI